MLALRALTVGSLPVAALRPLTPLPGPVILHVLLAIGLELLEQAGDFVWGMFGIENNPVEAGAGDDFGRDVAAKGTPETDLLLTGGDGGFEIIWRQSRHGVS